MTENSIRSGKTRREALHAVLAGVLLITVGPKAHAEDTAPTAHSEQFKKAYDAIVGGANVIEGGVTVELPEVAENGNFVPITIDVASPMTDADFIKRVVILSTANPTSVVATFHLTPLNGVARIQSRMRLANTQDVVVLAETSTGAFMKATLPVNVAIGGCQT